MGKRFRTEKMYEDGEFHGLYGVWVTYPGQLWDTFLGNIIKDPAGSGKCFVSDGLVQKQFDTMQGALGYFKRCY